MNVGHFPDHLDSMGTVAYGRTHDLLEHLPRIGEMVSPTPDKGIDGIGFFQEDDIDQEMHVTIVQAKSTGTIVKGKPRGLQDIKNIVSKMINQAPSVSALVQEAKRLNPKVTKLHIWYITVTNCTTTSKTPSTFADNVVTWQNKFDASLAEANTNGGAKPEDRAKIASKAGPAHRSTIIVDGVEVHAPLWLLCGRNAMCPNLPAAVKEWATANDIKVWSPDE